MKRIEELTHGMIDGILSSDEELELDALLANPENSACHAELIRTESYIRAELWPVDVAAETMTEIRRTLAQGIEREVIRSIRAKRGPSAPRRRLIFRRALLAAAAAVLLAVGGAWWGIIRSLRSDVRSPVLARVTEKVSGVTWQVAGGRRNEIRVGDAVREGTRIETKKGGTVRFQYLGEETFVNLSDQSDLSVCVRDPHAPSGKHLELRRGQLAATVAKQKPGAPFVVTTPLARVEVKGTVFSLSAADEYSRLDVTDGLVAFTRLSDGAALDVPAGRFAIAGDGYALKSYPAGTEYVEGPILFQDDFEAGSGNWDIVRRGSDGTAFAAAGAVERKCVSVQDRKRNGETRRCLVVDIPAGEKTSMGIRLRQPLLSGGYAAEWDLTTERVGTTVSTVHPGTESYTLLSKGSPFTMRVGQWVRMRLERVPCTGRPGSYDVRNWFDDVPTGHYRLESRDRSILLEVTGGKACIDGVVVRALAPGGNPKGGKGP